MYLANYLSDTTLLDCSLVEELPSKIAACCVYGALKFIKLGSNQKGSIWNSILSKHTTYKESDIK